MTFNADVDVGKLFQQIYFQVTGQNLQRLYSSGDRLFCRAGASEYPVSSLIISAIRKITADPTPMQVQMRKYEDDVNTTILEDLNRKNLCKNPNEKKAS